MKKRLGWKLFILINVMTILSTSCYGVCEYKPEEGWSSSCTPSEKLQFATDVENYDILSSSDWKQLSTTDLQGNLEAAKHALQNNMLTEQQRKDFLNHPGTDLGKIGFATVMQNHKYVDKKGQNFQKWLSTLSDMQRQEVWRQIGDFDGKLTSKEDWQRIMNQETIDAWFDNYQFGDILKFFSGLSFDITFL